MPGSAMIGNLAVNLSLETAAFQRGATLAEKRVEGMKAKFATVGKSISGFGAALGIGLGVAAISGLARNAFEMASALDESAQKMGVTVEALQQLNLAATQSGISQESLAGAMAKLNKNMGLLQQQSPQATAAFAKIGLAAEDLKNKSPDQALGIIADRLNKLPTIQERVAVGAQLMGRGFSELLPLINLGSAGLDKYAEKSRNMGQITTEEAKRLDELSDSWERVKVRLGVFTAKLIATGAEFVSKSNDMLAKWESMRDRFVAAAGDMASRVVGYISNMVSGIASAVTGKLSAVWEGAKQKIESVTGAFKTMWDRVVGHSYVPDMVAGIAQEFGRLGQIMVDPTISATEKVGAAFQTLQSVIGQVLGRKTGGIFNMIMSIGQAFAPLLGGLLGGAKIAPINLGLAMPVGVGSPIPRSSLPGFASGGGGRLGGFGGVDKNLLSLNGSPIARVSRNETLSVSPSNDRAPQRVIVELRDQLLDARIATGADVQIVRRYPAMKADTMSSLRDRSRRSA